ncbi:heme peroxidase family protein [Geodermatophilus sp. SYSU D01180]
MMARRHERRYFYLADKREMRGEGGVRRSATLSERERSFRFSEIVPGSTPEPSDALLERLAEVMTSPGEDVDGDIPAGFTYLGQFVDHDLTMDTTDKPLGTPVTTPDQLAQGRSPALDLDSVYGLGPRDAADRILYADDGVRFVLGRTQRSGPREVPATLMDLDGFDLPRKGASTADPLEARMAQIKDPRNDENLAVGQTHLAFLRFHNAVCDRLAGGTPSALLFQTARELVVKHYQWMLYTDYLPRIVDPEIVDDVFTNGRTVFEVDPVGTPTMPIEFSVAAFRLGHSMIRDSYDWNRVFNSGDAPFGDGGTLDNLFRFSGTSGNLSPGSDLDNPLDGDFERLPTNWIADWTRLYDFVADGSPDLAPEQDQLNVARPIDAHLTNPLATLPLGSFGARLDPQKPPDIQRNLAFRNLVRARMVGLATGQEVCAHIKARVPGVEELTAEQIVGDLDLPQELRDELTSATPLWFYVLREAELNGGRLGAVGGRIVAETFHRAMEGSRISILRDPYFRPSLGPDPDTFRMTDLLKVAYDARTGELRPLSSVPRPQPAVGVEPAAPRPRTPVPAS